MTPTARAAARGPVVRSCPRSAVPSIAILAQIDDGRLPPKDPAPRRLSSSYAGGVEEDETRPGSEFPTEFTAVSLTGSLSVRTTEQGLPLGVRVDAEELRGDPQRLAGEILRLCRQSANRAGLQRRNQLRDAGFSADMLALTGLPTEAEVARQEIIEEQEYETQPQSWLRSV